MIIFFSQNLLASEDLLIKGVRFFYPTKDSAQMLMLHNTKDFVFMRESSDQNMFLSFRVHVEVFMENGKSIYSENIPYKSDDIRDRDIPLEVSFPLQTGTYRVELEVKDINSSVTQRFKYNIKRRSGFNPENILPLDAKDGSVIYFSYTYADSIELYAPLLKNDSLDMNQYATSSFIAPPPFNKASGKMNFNQPESHKIIVFGDDGKVSLNSYKSGIYVISALQNLKPSFLVLHFQPDFPKIETVKSIAPPMRYITSTKEYNEITESPTIVEQRKAFEKFWLTCAKGSKAKAKNLIKTYFNRVEYTNQFYTSYKEGWKTDRGMIFIVFGKPDFKEEKNGVLTWVYGNKNRINSLVFEFEKIEGSVSPNDYALIRKPDFKTPWYIAIENWRSGQAYQFK